MGRVGAPHGVRGAFRVRPECADPASLLEHREWLLRVRDGAWTRHPVRDVRPQGDALVAQLDKLADEMRVKPIGARS